MKTSFNIILTGFLASVIALVIFQAMHADSGLTSTLPPAYDFAGYFEHTITFSGMSASIHTDANGLPDKIASTREPVVTKTNAGYVITFKPAAK